jgi:hypothetical protein
MIDALVNGYVNANRAWSAVIAAAPAAPQPTDTRNLTAEQVREAVTQFAGYLSVAVPELRALPHPTDLLEHVDAFLTKLGGRDE